MQTKNFYLRGIMLKSLFMLPLFLGLVFIVAIQTVSEGSPAVFTQSINSKSPPQQNSSILTSISYNSHTPIIVTNDFELASIAVSGTGAISDPYILENWSIITDGLNGIHIHSTTKYFIIRNCWIETGRSGFHYGIYIENVASGTATIVNNTCQNNEHGIYIGYSENSTVVNNLCTKNNGVGIILRWSNNSQVINNTCRQNGRGGISLASCGNSLVKNNSFHDNGLTLGENTISAYLSYSIINNRVNGLPLGFLTDKHNFLVTLPYGQLILVNCSNIVIQEQNCSNTNTGITLHYSNHCQIKDNVCQRNNYGIYLEDSRNVTITNNSCTQNNVTGITLTRSVNLTVINNLCSNNSQSGISMWNSGNSIVTNNYCTRNNQEGIRLTASENSMLMNNTCSQNGRKGFVLDGSENSTIMDNICQQNNDMGISLESSANATVMVNLCTQNNDIGISLEDSSHCSISGNLIAENRVYGASVAGASNNNSLHHNSLLKNNNGTIQAYDNGINNQWFDGSTNEGNYWLDYTGTGAYQLAGTAGATDPYPLEDVFDFDGDGLTDGAEVITYLTDPAILDSDGDGLTDGAEVIMHLTDPTMPDSDTDGLIDGEEVLKYNTDPLVSDSDADGLTDGEEVLKYNTNPRDSDSDADGLTDNEEVMIFNTNPNAVDSDGDGMPDGWEIKIALDPLNDDSRDDPDNDGFTNLQEYTHGTNPHDRDSDNDFFPDGLDYGWWGHPSRNWDNPLTRGLFLVFLLSMLVLVLWSGYIAYQLPKLQQDLRLLFQHFQQYVHQFNEHITTLQNHTTLEELEATAIHISLTFQSYEDFYLFATHLADCKWLPPFLRPDLTPWETLFATMQQHYEAFQQTRLERLEAKY